MTSRKVQLETSSSAPQTKDIVLHTPEHISPRQMPTMKEIPRMKSRMENEQQQSQQKQRRRAEIYAINALMREFSQAKMAAFIQQQQQLQRQPQQEQPIESTNVLPMGV
jgi:hypothetical protein